MNTSTPSRGFVGARTDNFVFSPVRERNRAKSFELVPGERSGISMGMEIPEPTCTTLPSEAALLDWFESAGPGDCFTYHIGHLAADRARETSGLTAAAREALGCLADRVMALAAEDLLIAVQRRLEDGRTAYLAVKPDARSTRRSTR